MGTPDFAGPTLQVLAGGGALIVGVYTQPDRPAGRRKKTSKSPVKLLAEGLGLPIFQPESLSTTESRAQLESLRPDVIVVAAYGLILPKWTIDLPTHGAVNVHPSLLPRHRGPAPVANAILEGDEVTGVTVMLVEPKVDSGPILGAITTEIGPRETAGKLEERLAVIGAQLLVDTLREWTLGRVGAVGQVDAMATYSRKATRADGEINWSLSAEEIDRRIRAYDPWPGSFTFWAGRRLKIIEALPTDDEGGKPGVVTRRPHGVVVQAGRGQIALKRVQPEGRRTMDIEAFLAGHPEFVGATLGD